MASPATPKEQSCRNLRKDGILVAMATRTAPRTVHYRHEWPRTVYAAHVAQLGKAAHTRPHGTPTRKPNTPTPPHPRGNHFPRSPPPWGTASASPGSTYSQVHVLISNQIPSIFYPCCYLQVNQTTGSFSRLQLKYNPRKHTHSVHPPPPPNAMWDDNNNLCVLAIWGHMSIPVKPLHLYQRLHVSDKTPTSRIQ